MKSELEQLDDVTDEFREVLGGAWDMGRVCLDIFHQDLEPTLAGDRLLKLDLPTLDLQKYTFASYYFKFPAIELALIGSRTLPRGIKKNETSNMNVLPHVVQLLIFFHLPVKDVARCMRASQEWNQLLNLNHFWCVLLERDYDNTVPLLSGKESYIFAHQKRKSLLRAVPDYRIVRERFNNIFDFFPPDEQADIIRQPWFSRDPHNPDLRFFRPNNDLLTALRPEAMYREAQPAMIEQAPLHVIEDEDHQDGKQVDVESDNEKSHRHNEL